MLLTVWLIFRPGVFLVCLLTAVGVCAAAEPQRLSLQEAIRLALLPAGQPRLQLAAEAETSAELRVQEARSVSALHVDAGIADRVTRFDLRSIGVDIPEVSPFVANVQYASVVGPFTVLDSRVRASKSLVNRSATEHVKAVQESVEAARTQSKAVAARITVETARAYLNAVRARSEADLAAESVKSSELRVSLAEARRSNGLAIGAEVRRANLDLAAARQSLFAAETAWRSALLSLVALIGLPLDTAVELTDRPAYRPENPQLDEAIRTAFASRIELAAGERELQGLRLNDRAIAAQSTPSLAIFADAGALTVAPTPNGTSNIVSSPTYTAGFELRMPILDGHRRATQRALIDSEIRQATIRQQAARRQIEVQVRLAVESLQSTAQQVELAQKSASLAEADSIETRARYDAGEASGLDLAESQARTFRSRHDYLMAVYQHEAARITFAEATGAIGGLQWQ
jgi:outer membrane protein